jgi:hypothetical protein
MGAPSEPSKQPAVPKWLVVAAAIVWIALVGFVDYVTGYEISLSLFYLPPVLAVAWYADRNSSLAIAVACTLVWLLAD